MHIYPPLLLPQVMGRGDATCYTTRTGGSAPAGFDPTVIADCVQWLLCEVATTWQDAALSVANDGSDGTAILGWQDKSGIGNHATQTDSSKAPKYKLAIAKGLPMLLFDGSNDFLQCNGIAPYFAGNDLAQTVALVFQKVTNTATDNLYAAGYTGSATAPQQRITVDTAYTVAKTSDGFATSATQSAGVPDTSAHTLVIRFNGTTVDMWLDGTQIMTALSFNTTTTSLINTGAICARVMSSVTGFADAYMGEVCLWSRALNAGEISQVNSGLLDRWI